MKARFLMFSLILLVCPDLFAASAQTVALGTTQHLHSVVLAEVRTYAVSLPASYQWASAQRYPVLYVLDGQDQFVHTVASAQFLAAQGEIPEMIVVGIDSTVRVRDFTQTDWPEMWIGGGGADTFVRFLGEELLPKIARDYRTDGYHILSGHSAGGQFALHVLAMHADLFRAYVALAPSLDWDNNLPQRELQKSLDATKSLPAFVYFAYGDDHRNALADDLALKAVLVEHAPAGLRSSSQHFPLESHGGIALLGQIDALRKLYAGYGMSNDMLQDADLVAVEQHYRELSKSLGWPVNIPESVINTLAYAQLGNGHVADAVALFMRNTTEHPESANAWDSLADGYAEALSWPQAIEAVDKAVALAIRNDLINRADFEHHAQKLHAKFQQTRAGTHN